MRKITDGLADMVGDVQDAVKAGVIPSRDPGFVEVTGMLKKHAVFTRKLGMTIAKKVQLQVTVRDDQASKIALGLEIATEVCQDVMETSKAGHDRLSSTVRERGVKLAADVQADAVRLQEMLDEATASLKQPTVKMTENEAKVPTAAAT